MDVTTILDLLGLLLLVVAAALFAAAFSLPAGIAVAGLGLILISWLIDRRDRRRK